MAATTAVGSRNQFSTAVSGGTVPSDLHIRDVSEWVRKLERTDVPYDKLISTAPAPDMPMHKAEWGWGSPDPYSDTLGANVSTTDGTSVTVSNGAYYQVGSVIVVGTERMRVESRASNVLTVERGFGGSTGATHTSGDTVIILAPAVVESADDADSPYTQGEVEFNYHQIMTYTWSLSNRADKTPTYEYKKGNRFNAELKKKMEMTAPVRMELNHLLGLRAQGSGSSASAFGGLDQSTYITTRTTVSGILTENTWMSNLQTVHNLVGPTLMPTICMASPLGCRIVSSWYNETRRTTGMDDKIRVHFTEIDTPFGRIKLVPNYLMSTVANDTMYFFNPSHIKRRPYATGTGWQTGEHSTQGWHKRGFLRADLTVLYPYPDARLELSGYSTTEGQYSGLA